MMPYRILFLTLLLWTVVQSAWHDPKIGSRWARMTISFKGPELSELSVPNPFTDFRLNAYFVHIASREKFKVPGFYAADGNAGNTSARKGSIWQVRFAPSRTGLWRYSVSFRRGPFAAAGRTRGEATDFHGESGAFDVLEGEYEEHDLRNKGRLQYVGQRYLRYSNGEYKLKLGTNSPENFLGYTSFDGRDGRLTFKTHAKDWREGDPTWGPEKRGKEIIGVVNYLARQKVNSLFSILLTVKGDSRGQVHPWLSQMYRLRYDVSRLDQWNILFEHAGSKGLSLNLAFLETENEALFEYESGNSTRTGFAVSRKIFYREIIARFAHNVGFTMTLGEENGWSEGEHNGGGHPWGVGNTHLQRQLFTKYIRKMDPYDSPIAVHTFPNLKNEVYGPMLGVKSGAFVESASLQMSKKRLTHKETKHWISRSIENGFPWVVSADEIGSDAKGLPGGVTTASAGRMREHFRAEFCWGNIMAGGAGMEVYSGPVDQSLNNFREFHAAWSEFSRPHALFKEHEIPFWAMNSMDEIVHSKKPLSESQWLFAFGKLGDIYLIYRSAGVRVLLNLEGYRGRFFVRWFDPRSDRSTDLQRGGLNSVQAGSNSTNLGASPSTEETDWVIFVSRTFPLSEKSRRALAVSPLDLIPGSLQLRDKSG